MQKKSFFIKDILQKLNEDEKSKINYLNQNNQQLSTENLKDVTQNEKKSFCDFSSLKFNIESNNFLSNWQSLAMAAISQNNTLSNKNFLNTNEINKQNLNNLTYFKNLDQSTLSNYFQLHSFANTNPQNYLKNSFNFINDLDISENSNNSFNCESSKFLDSDSDIDCDSGKSTPISIENCDEEVNSLTIRNSLSSEENKNFEKKLHDWKKEERKKKRKNRRNRTVFTELQLMGLERRFDSQKYLSTPDRAELANALGLSQLQVKTWYQNRRMKWKKQVMQGGCMVAPTKPKGRPKKNSIPSLGLIFDTSSLLSAVEARKNLQLASRELNNKFKPNLSFNEFININKKNETCIEQNSVKNSILNENIACSSNEQTNQNLVIDSNHNQALSRQFLSELEFSAKKAKLLIF